MSTITATIGFEEIKKILRQKFDDDDRIRELNVRATRMMSSGNYAEALQIRRQIEQLFDKVVVAYRKETESQVEEVTLDQAKCPAEDQQRINHLMVTLYMAVDIMDSCLLDVNNTLHRTDKTLNYEKIRDLQEMAHLCREQLRVFGKMADYLNYTEWGDISDNMYELMQNKAKALIRKVDAKRKTK